MRPRRTARLCRALHGGSPLRFSVLSGQGETLSNLGPVSLPSFQLLDLHVFRFLLRSAYATAAAPLAMIREKLCSKSAAVFSPLCRKFLSIVAAEMPFCGRVPRLRWPLSSAVKTGKRLTLTRRQRGALCRLDGCRSYLIGPRKTVSIRPHVRMRTRGL